MKVLKVKITRRPKGGFLYPNFDTLQTVIDSPLEWEGKTSAKWPMYVDEHGSGWMYDHTSDHRSVSVDSPRGVWLGMMVVPDDFADQAIVAFPATCSILKDSDAQTFYEEKHAINIAVDAPLKTWPAKKAKIGI